MEDFRIKTSWRASRKRRRLKRLLGAEGVLAIEDLWSYCAAERTDGDLTGLSNEDIADEVDWEGEPDELVDAFVRCGLLEGDAGTYRVHDWAQHNPYVATGGSRSEAGSKASHVRWHVNAGITKEDCEFCQEETAIDVSDANAMRSHAQGNADDASSNAHNQPTNHPSLLCCVWGEPRDESVASLNKRVEREFGVSIGPKWVPKARANGPYSKREIDEALKETQREAKPTPGLLVAILDRYRNQEAAKPRAGPARQERKRDLKLGWAPPSKEIGNGQQRV